MANTAKEQLKRHIDQLSKKSAAQKLTYIKKQMKEGTLYDITDKPKTLERLASAQKVVNSAGKAAGEVASAAFNLASSVKNTVGGEVSSSFELMGLQRKQRDLESKLKKDPKDKAAIKSLDEVKLKIRKNMDDASTRYRAKNK